MLNNSSQEARIFFSFSTFGTKWVCDQENINIHSDAPGNVIVELPWLPELSTLVSDTAATPLTN